MQPINPSTLLGHGAHGHETHRMLNGQGCFFVGHVALRRSAFGHRWRVTADVAVDAQEDDSIQSWGGGRPGGGVLVCSYCIYIDENG